MASCASPEWSAPPAAAAEKTPLQDEPGAAAAGRALFDRDCRECHGPRGRGDGPSSWMLCRPPPDLGGGATQRRSDGELFWKISEGDEEMPDFRRTLGDRERWQVVAHLRTLRTDR